MRLSDVQGERTFDVIAEIIEPIANIATDKECANLFKAEQLPDGMSPTNFAIVKIKKYLPRMLKQHKSDIITILAAIKGETSEAYTKNLNLLVLMKDATELLNDESFGMLFTSAQSLSEKKPSGFAQENTKES